MAKQNLIIRGGFDGSNITKGLNKSQAKLTGFQKSIGKTIKLIGLTLGGLAVGTLIKSTTKIAMSVESSMDNIDRNMGKSSQAFNNWAQNQSKSWGIARAEAYKYGSTFSNLLGSFQDDSKQTADSTEELMKAAAIIASKTGRTYEDTANRIRSGMLGSTEAIEDLGIYTQVSMIESTEAFKKFANGKSWAQLDFKVQQQIRLAAILEQTYARYGDTLANTTQTKQAIFLASLENIKLNLGQAFLPIYNVILPALTVLGNAFENITARISALSQAFFGKAISVEVSEVETGTGAIEDRGDAIEAAGKKAKKALAPFDELNKLSSASSGGGGGSIATSGSGSSGGATTVTKVSDTDTGFTKWLDKINGKLEPVKTALDKLKTSLSKVVDALAPLGIGVGKGFIRFLEDAEKVLKPVLVKSIEGLAVALDYFAIVLSKIDPKSMETIGYALGIFGGIKLGGKLIGILSKLGGGLNVFAGGLSSIMSMNPLMFVAVFDGLLHDIAGAIGDLLPQWIKDTYRGIMDAIIRIFDSTFSFSYAKEVAGRAVERFKSAFSGEDKAWYEIGADIIKGILLGIHGAFMFIVSPIYEFFTAVERELKNAFGIKSPAEKMKPIGRYIVLGIVEGFKGAFGSWSTAIEDFKTKTQSLFGGIGNSIKTGLEKALDGAGSAVSNWKIPTIGTNVILSGGLPNVKGYATGGFPQAGELFRGNENGIEMMGRMGNQNVVANNDQITTGIANAVESAMINTLVPALRSIGVNLSVELQGEADGMFKVVQKKSNDYYTRTGKVPFPT